MARPKMKLTRSHWVAQGYQDHTNQPVVLMIKKEVDPDANRELDLAPIPEFALQVYSTLPLDSDHTTLCQYLSREMDTWPSVSFEIYSTPQPDAFACVEHQRREIAYRKNNRVPSDGRFPGIAKVVPNSSDRIVQGFLLVITSHSYRTGFRNHPRYEEETGPLWVTFNRCFPPRAEVDEHSRLQYVPPIGYAPSLVEESELCPEREEIMVRKCRHIYHALHDLHYMLMRSYKDDMTFDYGLDEDEGDASLLDQPPAPDVVELWEKKAGSLSRDCFIVQLPPSEGGALLITSDPATPQPDLQYVIYVAFPHTSSQFPPIAQAFTAAVVENLPNRKTINFEFHTVSSSQSLGDVLATHRGLMDSRLEMTVGAYKSITTTGAAAPERKTRVFPQHRQEEDWIDTGLRQREPYQTFFVVIDRADFLTAPGVLFFLADGNEVTDEWLEKVPQGAGASERGDYWEYQVLRSVGMPEVARRLAMLGGEEE